MADMISFVGQVLAMIPSFLMTEPICYIVGFFFLGFAVNIVNSLRN